MRRNCFGLYLQSLIRNWPTEYQQILDNFVQLVNNNMQQKFTAGNFFDIERRIILNVLNTATTFLVPMVQLQTPGLNLVAQ